MSVKGGPGQGATLALTGDTAIMRLRTLQLPDWLSEAVDFSGLSDLVWLCFLPANLIDGGQFIAEFYHDTEMAVPTNNLVQDATITLPIQTAGNTTPWDLVGSGFVTNLGLPQAVIGEPLISTTTFKYDGLGTVPLISLESA